MNLQSSTRRCARVAHNLTRPHQRRVKSFPHLVEMHDIRLLHGNPTPLRLLRPPQRQRAPCPSRSNFPRHSLVSMVSHSPHHNIQLGQQTMWCQRLLSDDQPSQTNRRILHSTMPLNNLSNAFRLTKSFLRIVPPLKPSHDPSR